jgi:hypothetical protein
VDEVILRGELLEFFGLLAEDLVATFDKTLSFFPLLQGFSTSLLVVQETRRGMTDIGFVVVVCLALSLLGLDELFDLVKRLKALGLEKFELFNYFF